ncbi:recombinase family protein [Pelagibius sp.]|uniref:recombinase family protein n=1 Tax=Pelagibius sp. TaxID=1931238 RepID=UPI003B504F69
MAAERQARRRCAVYTRKSSEEGLDQAFNSLDAQREACEAYIKSQAGEGWKLVRTPYDDGGISGGTLERPALQQLLDDIRARRFDTVVVYKVDRLTRSLADFARIVEVFDAHAVSFVSVTQQFNTTTSMGRLTLNMLLSFAQFEREVTGERIRDKIAASKKKGLWMGGFVPLGYEAKDRTLVINEAEAETVRTVFRLYLEHGSVRRVKEEADRLSLTTKLRQSADDRMRGGCPLSRGYIYKLLGNPLYIGRIPHKGTSYEGQHPAIIDPGTWEAVQAKLANGAQERRSGTRAAEPSLLAGMLYDDRGNRLSPSHAVKKGVRYRYYVSQALLQQRDDAAGAVVRISAREIEELIATQLGGFLGDTQKVMDELCGSLGARDRRRLITAAKNKADKWRHMSTTDRRAMLISTWATITVHQDGVRTVLCRNALRDTLLCEASSHAAANGPRRPTPSSGTEDRLVLVSPARFKLSSGEMRLVIPPAYAKDRSPRPNAPLIKAVVNAHKWKEKLFAGDASSVLAIAKNEGVTDRYVARILRLAFLAPEIVQRTLDGCQPADLELKQLMQNIPLTWDEQCKLLGFGSS